MIFPGGPKRPSAYNLYMRDHKEAVRQVIYDPLNPIPNQVLGQSKLDTLRSQ